MMLYLSLFSLSLSTLLSWVIKTVGFYAVPSNRCSHKHPTPTSGGLAFSISFFLTSFGAKFLGIISLPSLNIFCIGSLILGAISFYDDYRPLPYYIRLLAHFLSVGFLVESDLYLHLSTSLWISIPISLIFLVGLLNGTNFVDGLNGLLSGCVMITLFFLLFLLPQGHTIWLLSLFLLMSLCGFFIFNFPKASLFMGDVGSTFIGFSLGFLALLSQSIPLSSDIPFLHPYFFYFLFPLSFLGVDVITTLCWRLIKKRSIAEPHRDYRFLKLHDRGWSHTEVSCLHFLGVAFLSGLTMLHFYKIISFLNLVSFYVCTQIIFFIWVDFFLLKKNDPCNT